MNLERHTPGRVSLGIKLKRMVWNVTSALLFRPFITPVFRKWRLLLLRMFGAEVEWDANVYASVKVWAPWMLRMGHRACLGAEVICYNQDMVVLEDDAIVSQYSYLCTAGHDTYYANTADSNLITSPIVLRRGAWIGTSAFIGMGVEIGKNAVVGATASVYNNVEPWTIVGGNPAKVIKKRKTKQNFISLKKNLLDTTENALLEILKREVAGQDGTENTELSVAELNAVMRLAREHAVTGMVANAAVQNRIVITGGAKEGKGETVMKLMQQSMAHRQTILRFEDAVGRFARLMKENSIAYVVFKGLTVARHYPAPYTRTMGDVDFYIPQSDFLRAVEVIERELHVVIEKEDIDKHFSFEYQDIRFEMHYQIETFGNGRHQRYFNRMIDESIAQGKNSYSIADSGTGSSETRVSVLPPTEDLIVVFKHWFNHLLLEGVGLRQTTDLAVLLMAYKDKIDVARLMIVLENIGYIKAFRAMLAMTRKYFDLNCVDNFCVLNGRDERYADKLMVTIMESGNFGRKAYKNHSVGWKKSIETATRALRHCIRFLKLAPLDICCLIPKRIWITVKQKI